ncbi:WS/DGAT domain-containing protein [Terrimonas rubra]|uniref:WS/DGAT domain-containing protein n=1 Tax=Terrimonas rubra TaxID=1035890 RepID=A0ABW6A256_9BACT
MNSFLHKLPAKVYLTGSDCFHLVLDKHAKKYQAGGNVMRIVFNTEDRVDSKNLQQIFAGSPVIHWLCNIQLKAGALFGRPYWQYTNKGHEIIIRAHHHDVFNEIPGIVLQRDIPVEGERFIECDIIQYPDHRSLIVVSWNHILIDGRGIGMLISHLNEVTAGNFSANISNLFPAKEKPSGILAHIRNMYKVKNFIEQSSKPPLASVAAVSSKARAPFKTKIIYFNEEETGQIHRNAISHGARLGPNLFYIACCSHAVNKLLKQRNTQGTLWLPVPYDGRLRGAVGPVISNTVAFFFYRMPQQVLQQVKQTVSSLSEQMTEQIKNKRPQLYSQLLNMMRHLPVWLYYKLVNKTGEGTFTSFVYSATGEGFNNHKSFMGHAVSGLTIYPSPTFPPGLTFSFLKFNNALNINIAYSPDIIDTFEIALIEEELKKLLSTAS